MVTLWKEIWIISVVLLYKYYFNQIDMLIWLSQLTCCWFQWLNDLFTSSFNLNALTFLVIFIWVLCTITLKFNQFLKILFIICFIENLSYCFKTIKIEIIEITNSLKILILRMFSILLGIYLEFKAIPWMLTLFSTYQPSETTQVRI